ncbi:hypothetical protein [Mesorhizobium sp.]|uniref:hypothetical protein n=1 Tax=Mesorhizobium sp. TaxID=1871066 RepID=UPI001227730A|nr:hypothetical protein [Mesorhizobium sp.]TIL40238.1 MAG: hypothetical protein E5Y82_06905 [Mesorhizobium sp.]
MRWISLSMVMAATSQSALAADEQGMFVTGGGMGSVSCPELVDGMALVRQRGGIKSPQGVQATNEFKQYVRGFRTGYNMAAPKVSDAFASLGDDVVAKSIVFIDSWCTKHPEGTFDLGLLELVKTLKDNAKSN